MSTSLRNNLSLVVLYASSLVVLLAFCAWMYAARPDGNATGYPAVETSLRVSVDGDLSGSIAESVALRPDWSNDATDFDYRRLESICLGIGSSTDQDLGLYSLGLADGPDIETRSQVWARYDLVSGCRSSSIVSWETPGDNATVLLSGVSDYLDRHTDGWSGLGGRRGRRLVCAVVKTQRSGGVRRRDKGPGLCDCISARDGGISPVERAGPHECRCHRPPRRPELDVDVRGPCDRRRGLVCRRRRLQRRGQQDCGRSHSMGNRHGTVQFRPGRC